MKKRAVKLVGLDMDGVLVPVKNSWNVLHEHFGALAEADMLAKAFFEGKMLSYYEWLYAATKLWVEKARRPVLRREIEEVLSRIPLTPGFAEVVAELKRRGKRVVVVSGGVSLLAERVAREVGADEWYASLLVFDREGRLVPGGIPLVEAGKKDKVLREVMARLGAEPSEAAFVGDSEWDREAFAAVGLAIVYGGDPEEHGACARADKPEDVLELVEKYEAGELECKEPDRFA